MFYILYIGADTVHPLIMKLTLLISDQIILINGQQWSWTALTTAEGALGWSLLFLVSQTLKPTSSQNPSALCRPSLTSLY